MKKTVRILCILLALTMMLAMASGCTKGQTTESTAPTASGDGPATPAAETQLVNDPEPGSEPPEEIISVYPITTNGETLKLWNSWSSVLPPYMEDPNSSQAYQMAEEITGVHINFNLVTDDVKYEKFTLMLASRDYPDLTDTRNYTGGGDKAIEDDFLIRLNELAEQYAPNYMATRTRDTEIAKATLTDSGNMYSFFSIYIENDGPTAFLGLAAREDWLDAAGITELPETYDEYYNMLTAFKDLGHPGAMMIGNSGVPMNHKLVAGYGVAAHMANTFMVSYPYYQVGGTVKCGIAEDGFKEYLEMISKWYSEDLINKNFITQDLFFGTPSFMQGILSDDVGVMTIPVQMFSDLERNSGNPDFKITALSDPVKVKGDKTNFLSVDGQPFVAMDRSIGVTTACKIPEIAVQWLDFWFTQEGSTLVNYGVEGEGLIYDESGKPMVSDLILNNPDGLPTNITTVLYTVSNVVGLESYSRLTQEMTESQEAAYGIWTKNFDMDNSHDLPSGIALSGDEASRFAELYGDINSYATEMILRFITGEVSLSEWDTYITTLNDMKLSETIQIYQKALDRYNNR